MKRALEKKSDAFLPHFALGALYANASRWDEAEPELRAYVASWVWNSLDPRRTLFDRAVVWLVKNRVLLPGITVLARAVAEVRSGELALIHAVVDEAIPVSLRRGLVELVAVPDGEVFSTLEMWRTPPKDRSG